jgi:hypothetical protein
LPTLLRHLWGITKLKKSTQAQQLVTGTLLLGGDCLQQTRTPHASQQGILILLSRG